jgi:hypothetical protein
MSHPNLQQFQQLMDDNLWSTGLDVSSSTLMALFEAKLGGDVSSDEASLRLAIYRNNVIHSLSSALGDLYPVIKKLIGDDCFNGAAIEFVRCQPPQHAALLHYGNGFREFIAEFEPCMAFKFLPDIASLEFDYNQAYHSADVEPFDPQTLGSIAPELLGEVSFTCHPSLRLLQSAWPTDDIWHENQKDEPDIINLDNCSGANLLIYRLELTVQLVNLDENCFIFLEQLVNNQTINQAWAQTYALAQSQQRQLGDEELSGMLGYLFSLEIFTAFEVNA